MQTKKNEVLVGVFFVFAILLMLCIFFYNTDSMFMRTKPTYRIYATFSNVGTLKEHSPVRIGGVTVGRVNSITLNNKTYLPCVAIDIEKRYNHIPDTSSLSICTSGLLGEQYLSINIGFEAQDFGTSYLKDEGIIRNTKSAIVLEDIIGQFFYRGK